MKNSCAIIGTGRVGSTVAYTCLIKNLFSQLLLVDTNTEKCEGEVRDLADALAFSQTAHIQAATIDQIKNVDIIIIAAGKAQELGQDRLKLYQHNKAIIQNIMRDISSHNPNAIVIIITNPMDLMTLAAQQASSLPKNHILGTGTWLDTQRLRRYLSEELMVAPESIDAFVIGEHGDSQCIVWSQAKISGTAITDMKISQNTIEQISEKTKQEAYKIIEKKCATYYGIAACVADICEAIIFDQKRILPLSSFIKEFDVCMSIPVVVGAQGIEQTFPLHLNEEERECLKTSGEEIKKIITSTS